MQASTAAWTWVRIASESSNNDVTSATRRDHSRTSRANSRTRRSLTVNASQDSPADDSTLSCTHQHTQLDIPAQGSLVGV